MTAAHALSVEGHPTPYPPTGRALFGSHGQDLVNQFAAISLDELNQAAALQTRTDRKYILDHEQYELFLRQVAQYSRVLEIDGRRWMSYRSVYFDTPGLAAYVGAARSRPHRFKVRTRLYADTGACFIEAKLKNALGQTVKERIARSSTDLGELTVEDRHFLARFSLIAPLIGDLQPTLRTDYRRATLLLSATQTTIADAIELGRVTIDQDVQCATFDGTRVSLEDRVLIETKSPGAPSPADRVLWRMGIRPQRISKYGSGLAALRPDLPSNKWRRVIDRHLHTLAK